MRRKTVLAAVLCISAAAVVCGSDFEQRISEKHWLRDYYNEVIYRKDRNIVIGYLTYYKVEPSWFEASLDDEVFWFDNSSFAPRFDEITFLGRNEDDDVYPFCLYVGYQEFDYRINKLNSDLYEMQIKDVRISEIHYEYLWSSGNDMRFARDAAEPEYSLYFQFDGEYLYVYLEDGKTLYATYCAYDEAEFLALREAVSTNEFDLSRFTFPVHADGSCEYDKAKAETIKTAKIEHGIYRVTENLRLREAADASSAVITTMQAGTLVQIRSIGKEETIDGITDNWVKAAVQFGGRNKDGIVIWGTTGWCFGGYLQ